MKHLLLCLLCCCVSASSVRGDDIVVTSPTPTMYGSIGLNTVPSARMDKKGTMRLTMARSAPYIHSTLGLQISDRLYLGLRQTADAPQFNSEAEHLYPGMDVKLKLFSEKKYRPEIALGLQSALGHKKMAAEYLALSKRVDRLDFTTGFGWGRLGTRQSLPNPVVLKHLSSHNSRSLDGENPNTPEDWFDGPMGIFGGVEYQTPINGLAVKADWTSDDFEAEKFDDPDHAHYVPWSLGVAYQPYKWMTAGLAYGGFQQVMGYISFSPSLIAWPFKSSPESAQPDLIPTTVNGGKGESFLIRLLEGKTTPTQVGYVASDISNASGPTPQEIKMHVTTMGLTGPDITLNTRDIDQAIRRKQGSPEEIWRHALFDRFDEKEGVAYAPRKPYGFRLNLANDVSLSEEDTGLVYRTGLIGAYQKNLGRHFIAGQSLRFNIADNLRGLNTNRVPSLLPVRSNVANFVHNTVNLDRNHITGLATPFHDLHIAASIGYLEEMYAGASGEMLYRPFGKSWAIGLESALALKRDPLSPLALDMNGDHILTGFLNGYYEVPNTGATFTASIGRYLAGDFGGSLELANTFENGVKVSGSITSTNASDVDAYGGRTNIYAGIKLSIPLGSLPYLPDNSSLSVNAYPLGRDTAQRLDLPVPLYDATEPLSYRHITQHWSQLLK